MALERYPVLTFGSSELLLQLEADVRGKGLGSDQRWTICLDGVVLARLFGPLMVYGQLEWFGIQADGPAQDFGRPSRAGTWSTQTRISAGLAITALFALQSHEATPPAPRRARDSGPIGRSRQALTAGPARTCVMGRRHVTP